MPHSQIPARDSTQLIELAARLMHEDAVADPASALRRAAKKLGQQPVRWPHVDLVRAALKSRLMLFERDDHAAQLAQQRRAALEALEFLSGFAPRLTGAVVDGTATAHSKLDLELRAEHPDDVLQFLLEKRIPIDQSSTPPQSAAQFVFTAGAFTYRLRVITPDLLARRSEPYLDATQLRRVLDRP